MRKHSWAEIAFMLQDQSLLRLELWVRGEGEGDGDLDWGQIIMFLNTSHANFLLLL